MITGSNQKSGGEVDRLVNDVLLADEFQAEELVGFNARRANKELNDSETIRAGKPYISDGWHETHIDIDIPLGAKSVTGITQSFSVPGLHYRSLLSVMKSALTDVTALQFHFSPFKRLWSTPGGKEERCFDEAYTSDAWIKAHNDLQKQRNEPNCKFEKIILGLMFWSDSTHLANFGTAKVWPLYLYFGNLSKYFCGKPSSGASHHVAYIPSVCLFHIILQLADLKCNYRSRMKFMTRFRATVRKLTYSHIAVVSSCMVSGISFLTTTLSRLIVMDSPWSAWTVCGADSIHEYLHILRTTLKSRFSDCQSTGVLLTYMIQSAVSHHPQ